MNTRPFAPAVFNQVKDALAVAALARKVFPKSKISVNAYQTMFKENSYFISLRQGKGSLARVLYESEVENIRHLAGKAMGTK